MYQIRTNFGNYKKTDNLKKTNLASITVFFKGSKVDLCINVISLYNQAFRMLYLGMTQILI